MPAAPRQASRLRLIPLIQLAGLFLFCACAGNPGTTPAIHSFSRAAQAPNASELKATLSAELEQLGMGPNKAPGEEYTVQLGNPRYPGSDYTFAQPLSVTGTNPWTP